MEALGLSFGWFFWDAPTTVFVLTKKHAETLIQQLLSEEHISEEQAKTLREEVAASDLAEDTAALLDKARAFAMPAEHKGEKVYLPCGDEDCPYTRISGLGHGFAVYATHVRAIHDVNDMVEFAFGTTRLRENPMTIPDAITAILEAANAKLPLDQLEMEECLAAMEPDEAEEVRKHQRAHEDHARQLKEKLLVNSVLRRALAEILEF